MAQSPTEPCPRDEDKGVRIAFDQSQKLSDNNELLPVRFFTGPVRIQQDQRERQSINEYRSPPLSICPLKAEQCPDPYFIQPPAAAKK